MPEKRSVSIRDAFWGTFSVTLETMGRFLPICGVLENASTTYDFQDPTGSSGQVRKRYRGPHGDYYFKRRFQIMAREEDLDGLGPEGRRIYIYRERERERILNLHARPTGARSRSRHLCISGLPKTFYCCATSLEAVPKRYVSVRNPSKSFKNAVVARNPSKSFENAVASGRSPSMPLNSVVPSFEITRCH